MCFNNNLDLTFSYKDNGNLSYIYYYDSSFYSSSYSYYYYRYYYYYIYSDSYYYSWSTLDFRISFLEVLVDHG